MHDKGGDFLRLNHPLLRMRFDDLADNGHVRERLAREGRIHGPALQSERLISKGYTNAEKAFAGNYAVGDVVAFHRLYKRIGVEKGDERLVAGVDHKGREVLLDGGEGGTVRWKLGEIAGRRGGSEVYRAEAIELRAGDRVRWTRNDKALGLVNSHIAEVMAVIGGRVSFRLEDGRMLSLTKAIRSCAISTMPGPRPCMRSRAAPSTT